MTAYPYEVHDYDVVVVGAGVGVAACMAGLATAAGAGNRTARMNWQRINRQARVRICDRSMTCSSFENKETYLLRWQVAGFC